MESVLLSKTECDNEDIVCFLVEDGGFIIAAITPTNNETYKAPIGEFLGMIDPSLLIQLQLDGVFLR